MVLNRRERTIIHTQFENLPDFLARGDLLIFNDTRVIPARLLGRKAGTGGKVEVFLLRKVSGRRWEALVQPGRRCKPGTEVIIDDKQSFRIVVGEYLQPGKRIVTLHTTGPLEHALSRHGHTPLPPYISRPDERRDRQDYQTIFARRSGAVASPTAGLHFDRVMMNKIAAAGLYRAEVTLHVGEGSFRPIKRDRVEDHQLETEEFFVSRATIRKVAARRRVGKRIVAVGTTVTRTLETLARWPPHPVAKWDTPSGRPERTRGESDLFITEPYNFRVVDALVTNFHLPRSSLLVMVSAFAGREFVLRAYREAVKKGYRFYSYGDSMLIV